MGAAQSFEMFICIEHSLERVISVFTTIRTCSETLFVSDCLSYVMTAFWLHHLLLWLWNVRWPQLFIVMLSLGEPSVTFEDITFLRNTGNWLLKDTALHGVKLRPHLTLPTIFYICTLTVTWKNEISVLQWPRPFYTASNPTLLPL